MQKQILIIADPEDLHARVVSWEVQKRGAQAQVLKLSDLPAQAQMTWSSNPNSANPITLCNGDSLASDALTGVWWRRTHPFKVPSAVEDAKERAFGANESEVLLHGWFHALGDRLINPFAAEIITRNKLYQLQVAQQVGMRVPATLVSNDPVEVTRFIETQADGAIYKVLSNSPGLITPFTRRVTQDVLKHLQTLVTGPALFQQFIRGLDIRATFVDGQIFAAEIEIDRDYAEEDWRKDPNSITRKHHMSDEMVRKIQAFCQHTGLRYGAFDFRLADGEYWFFEVNTGGQYLWLETEANLPISAAIAQALLR